MYVVIDIHIETTVSNLLTAFVIAFMLPGNYKGIAR